MPDYFVSDPIVNRPEIKESIQFSPTFQVFGPAAYEQGKAITSFSAITDLATLGVIRGSQSTNVFGAAYDAVFGGEDQTPIGQVLEPEEANEKFGLDKEGNRILNFTKPVSAAEAQFTRDKKIREIKNQEILRRVEGIGPNTVSLLTETLPEFVDPVGFASLFVPFLSGSTFKRGFLEGAGSVGLSLTPGGIAGTEMQSTFDSQQLVFTILAGGVFSGAIGAAVGGVSKGLNKVAKNVHEKQMAKFQAEEKALKEQYHPEINDKDFEVAMREIVTEGKVSIIEDVAAFRDIGEATRAARDLKVELTELIRLKEKATNPDDVSLINSKILEVHNGIEQVHKKQQKLVSAKADKSLEKPPEDKKPSPGKVTKVEGPTSPEQKENALARIEQSDGRSEQSLRNDLKIVFDKDPTIRAFIDEVPLKTLRKLLKGDKNKLHLSGDAKVDLRDRIRLSKDFGKFVGEPNSRQLNLFGDNSDVLIKGIPEHQEGELFLARLNAVKARLKDKATGADADNIKAIDDVPEPVSAEILQKLKDKHNTDQIVSIRDITGEESTLSGLERQLEALPGDEDYVKLSPIDKAKMRKIIRLLKDQEADLKKSADDEKAVIDTANCLTFDPANPNI